MTVWLTLREAAEYIKAKDAGTLRAAVNRGDLPASTYGKKEIRLKAADLDAWLESQPWEPKTA